MSLVHNERAKLLAANLDRASSGALAAGFITPTASLATGAPSITFSLGLAVSTMIWILAAVALHMVARAVLGGLRE